MLYIYIKKKTNAWKAGYFTEVFTHINDIPGSIITRLESDSELDPQ